MKVNHFSLQCSITFLSQLSKISGTFTILQNTKTFRSITPDSSNSDVFYVERSSGEESTAESNNWNVLNPTNLFGVHARDVIRMSSLASPQLYIVTIESDSTKMKIPYAYGNQQPIIPPSINDLHLPINFFKMMTPISPGPITKVRTHPPEIVEIQTQQEVFDVSDISTPSRLVSSVYAWEASLRVATFYSDELRRRSPGSNSSSTPLRPRKKKRKQVCCHTPSHPRCGKKLANLFSTTAMGGSVAAYLQSLRLTPTTRNDTPMLRVKSESYASIQTLNRKFYTYL